MLGANLGLLLYREVSVMDFIDTVLSEQKDKDFSEETLQILPFLIFTSTDFGENLI